MKNHKNANIVYERYFSRLTCSTFIVEATTADSKLHHVTSWRYLTLALTI